MKVKFLVLILIATISVSLVLVSCSKSGSSGGIPTPTPTPTPTTVDCSTVPSKFGADVNPIIQATCNVSGCHNSGSVNGPGPLTNFTQINAASAQIRTAVVSKIMPKVGSLNDAEIHKIMCWVDGGALNN